MSSSQKHSDSTSGGDTQIPAKKPYATPTLIEYGHLQKLTVKNGTSIDARGGRRMEHHHMGMEMGRDD